MPSKSNASPAENPRQSLGKWGETLAAEYLSQQGYEVLERNVRTPYGEIDIIARQPSFTSPFTSLVFVEVRTRASSLLGPPEYSVNPKKQEHLRQAIQHYMLQHHEIKTDWRVDVIAIRRSGLNQPPEITHFENAFS